jgi:hypothetical protein
VFEPLTGTRITQLPSSRIGFTLADAVDTGFESKCSHTLALSMGDGNRHSPLTNTGIGLTLESVERQAEISADWSSRMG